MENPQRDPNSIPGKWQAFPACLTFGACGLSVSGITINAPGRPNTSAMPAKFAGGELIGSGKSETPCARMHAADSIALERLAARDGLLALPEDPQAAIAALARTAMTVERELT